MIAVSDNILVKKARHRANDIILLEFHKRVDWLHQIKRLNQIRYSRTLGYWYLPYTKSAYNEFLTLNLPFTIISPQVVSNDTTVVPAADLDRSDISSNEEPLVLPVSGQQETNIQDASNEVEVTWNSSKLMLSIPYKPKDLAFAKQLKSSYWHQNERKWICEASITNLKAIQEYWNVWTEKAYEQLFEQISKVNNPCKLKLYYSPQYVGKVCVQLIGYGANHEVLKRISNRKYLKQQKVYLIDTDAAVIKEVIDQYESLGYRIENRLPRVQNSSANKAKVGKVSRFLNDVKPQYRAEMQKMAYAMHSQGYGVKTILSYCGKLIKMLDYYKVVSLKDLSIDQVKTYIEYLSRLGVSFSLINQVHSAAKYYYSRVETDKIYNIQKLTRPCTPKSLPKFLSKQEILKLFDAIDNLKHIAIVYIMYGSGLRRQELLDIELKHVYWDRNQILISHGKGGKDRMVNIGQEAKQILQSYFHQYQPQTYLFEGIKAGQKYGASSVSSIVKHAARKAKLSKRVTPHMLRHSFATHLMDQGIALPKIQKLLGHKDVKTTMIYMHVSNKDINEVISPLDIIKKVDSATEKS